MTTPRLVHIEAQDPKFFTFRRQHIWIFFMLSALSILTTLLFQEVGLALSVIIFAGLILKVQLDLYHKTQVENFYHYREIEALLSIHSLIKIRYPLPPMRLWVISPDFATLITGMIQQHKPKVIVELGSGTSTLICCYTLESIGEGSVISYEHIENFTQETRNNLKKHQLEKWAEVIYAPLKSVTLHGMVHQWYDPVSMNDIPLIDMLIVDGPPDGTNKFARFPALPMLFNHLSPGAIILVDDFMREDEHEMVNRWLREFDLEMVEAVANEKGAAIIRKLG